MDIVRYTLLFLVLVFASSSAVAATNNDFDQGVKYFKQQQYRKAIRSFSTAYRSGLKTPALFHNLAVSYYKLEDYEQAKKFFRLARNYPEQRILAEYNLGLVAKKQNQPDRAKKHFTLVKNEAKDRKLITLARIQLGEVKVLEEQQRWSAYSNLSYGYDNNITAVQDNSPTQKSSHYAYLYFAPHVRLLGDASDGISLMASISAYDYINYDRYDYSKAAIGLTGKIRVGAWRYNLGLENQKSKYGHVEYQDTIHLDTDIKAYINSNNSLQLRYQHDEIDSGNPTYQYLIGTRQRLRASLRSAGSSYYAKLYYEYEQNDRKNTANTSASPVRHLSSVYYEYKLTEAFKIGAGYNYRVSLYPATGTSPKREDIRERTNLRLTYNFNKIWAVRAEFEQTHNESSTARYAYQREMTSISLSAYF